MNNDSLPRWVQVVATMAIIGIVVVSCIASVGVLYGIFWLGTQQVASPEPTVKVEELNPSGSVYNPAEPVAIDLPPGNVVGKCDWLRANFPQTTEGVQALGAQLAGIDDIQRVATHGYRCEPGSMVFDGFIVLGPSEGWGEPFSLDVPSGGVVDIHTGATCSGNSALIGAETDTWRCYSGTVTAVRATYWPWHDQDPPVSGGVSVQPAAQVASMESAVGDACVDSVTLATERGWSITGTANTYGGIVVVVDEDENLPVDWMADGPGDLSIGELDVNRTLKAGTTYTVYPPYSCRDGLGYAK
jgi:hypothetical protein